MEKPQLTLSAVGADTSYIRAWASDPDLAQFFRRFPPVWSITDDQLRTLLATTYIIRDGETPRGLLAFVGIDHTNRRVDLGVLVTPGPHRRELAIEACKVAGEYIFNTLDFEKVSCQVLASRKGLQELLQSFGFKKEAHLRRHTFFRGEWHDEVILSLLKEEYRRG